MVLSIWQRLSRWIQPVPPDQPRTSVSEASRPHALSPKMKRRFILPDAFDPDREVIPTPGFGQKIEELQSAGRYRTAIEEIFRILDRDPGNQEALFCAANILSLPRTHQLKAVEPLSDRYTLDQRLNPLWAMCHKCERTWVPSAVHFGPIFGGAQLHITNPIGQQCPKCGYTLCHECLTLIPSGPGYGVYSHQCPHGCGVDLSFPVRPTGRKNLQLGRRPQAVTHVFIFREGPIQPDIDYVQAFLEMRSPDVLENRPTIFAIPVGKWPDDEGFLFYVIASLMARGITKEMIDNWETGTGIDDDGARVHVVKLYAAK